MSQLTEHFSQAELTVSEYASRKGISNQPPPDLVPNLRRLAGVLEEVRKLVGGAIVVTSGYRSPTVNAAIGGSATSAHMKALAADINHPGMTPKQLAETIVASSIAFDQIILEWNSWVHIGLSAGTPRRQVLTKDATHDYAPGLH